MDVSIMTLCFVIKNNQVLLGLKKKKALGQGRWNGFGGHVDIGESIKDATRREVLEEAGIGVVDLKKIGTILYVNHTRENKVHIYKASQYNGEPRETEEMLSKWFNINQVMSAEINLWPDMLLWFGNILTNCYFEGNVYYDNANIEVLAHTLKPFCVPSRICLGI